MPRHSGLTRVAAAILAGVAVLLICAMPQPAGALTCERPAEPAPFLAARNLGTLKDRVRAYACSGAYDRAVERVLQRARAQLERRVGHVAKPAIVFDIDETALSNWPAIEANDFGYIADGPCDRLPKGPCGWHEWEKLAKAAAIAPTLALFNAAKAKGVALIFLTGRRDGAELRAATEQNLRNAGYDGWAMLIMRSAETASWTAERYKTAERAKIAQDHTIIINVGDQRSDLDGGHAERSFLVPNPFYFIK